VRTSVRASWIFVGVLVITAAVLRLYDLDAYGWVPDHYERLADARRIVSGELPDSRVYPQGASLIFALPIAISDSLITTQVVVALFGVAMVPLAYWGGMRLLKDQTAALLLAVIVALDPLQIWAARTGFIDTIVASLIILLIFTLPLMKGRGVAAFMAYGLLVGLLVLIRPTNAIVIPPLIFYWLAISRTGWNPVQVGRSLLTRPILAASVAFAAFVAVAVATGNWLFGGYSSDMLTLDYVAVNLVKTVAASFRGILGLALIAPAMVVGARRLWKSDRPFLATVAFFCVLWAVVHAPFSFFNDRYMLPITFFVLMLASLGWVSMLARTTPRLITPARAFGMYTAATLVLAFGVAGAEKVFSWPDEAALSDAGMAEQIRPQLQDLAPGALVVSVVTDAVERDNSHLDYLDLFALASLELDKEIGAGTVNDIVAGALAECRPVYYLQSRYEQPAQLYGGIWDGFRTYFEAVGRDFAMTTVWRSERHPEDAPWILFSVAPLSPAPSCS
jgi:hypothetical protein